MKRSHHEFRLALVGHDNAELTEQLEAFLAGESRANTSNGRISGTPSNPVFVCSGMGQQWWAMGRELLAQEPVFRRALEEVSDLFGGLAGWSLLDKLTADEQASRIQETRIGQPAIFALQVALAALWRSWGVEPAAVLGHSAGEMAASYISGALSLEDAVRVTFHRSRLQYRTAGQGRCWPWGCPARRRPDGRTLPARHLDRGRQRPELDHALGRRSGARRDRQGAQRRGPFSRALRVDVPYHSPKMEQLEVELLDCLGDIRPRPASTPFFSTVTGTASRAPRSMRGIGTGTSGSRSFSMTQSQDLSTPGTRYSSRSVHIRS